MRLSLPLILLLGAAHTGCGTDIEDTTATFEKQLTWHQVPGEIQDCHVFKLDNARHVEINRLQVQFPQGSHHVHIYRTSEPVEDKVYDCFGGIDWTKWTLLVGAQTKSMDWQLPDGVTVPLEPHQQLLAQVHWMNTSSEAIDPTIKLSFQSTDYSEEHLGTVFGVNQRVDIAAGVEDTTVSTWCEVPEGAKLHAMMGHFHKHGKEYKVTERGERDATGTLIYQAADEPTFDFKLWNPAHEVAPKMGFEYSCRFNNTNGNAITWGSDTATQEHCNMTAYYSPADTHKPSLCLVPKSKLASLTTDRTTANVDDMIPFAVNLASPEKQDLTVYLFPSDATALEAPPYVVVKAGETTATFFAKALRPAPVSISANEGGASVQTSVRIGGLVISEVFYQGATGGAADHLQWIELHNQTGKAIDLSKYSLGAGTDDYATTRVALPMMIEPNGCIVVGGPNSVPENHLPELNLPVDLQPKLGIGGAKAQGIALFSSPMGYVMKDQRPLDVVVYGGPNSSLVGPDGQIAPVWAGSDPGGSLRRVNEMVWTKSSSPTPGRCEVYNAAH